MPKRSLPTSARAWRVGLCLGVGAASLVQGNGCSRALLELSAPTDTVGLKIQSYCPASGSTYSQAFANNQSAILTTTGWQPSTDRDFQTDSFKRSPANMALYGFRAGVSDSVQAGYRDGFLVAMGYTAAGVRPPSCAAPYVDFDGDGLYDCEETLIASNTVNMVTNGDSDGDGIPDGVEFRMGLNPLDPADAQVESSAPGVTNLMASYLHLLLNQTPTHLLAPLPYAYQTTLLAGGCYSFRITNIPKMQVTNGNMLEVVILSKALDNTPHVDFVRVLVPRSTASGSVIVVPAVSNQTIDPRVTPLVFE